jgi:hypothetical protein
VFFVIFSAFASHAGVLYMELFNSKIGGLMQLFCLSVLCPSTDLRQIFYSLFNPP